MPKRVRFVLRWPRIGEAVRNSLTQCLQRRSIYWTGQFSARVGSILRGNTKHEQRDGAPANMAPSNKNGDVGIQADEFVGNSSRMSFEGRTPAADQAVANASITYKVAFERFVRDELPLIRAFDNRFSGSVEESVVASGTFIDSGANQLPGVEDESWLNVGIEQQASIGPTDTEIETPFAKEMPPPLPKPPNAGEPRLPGNEKMPAWPWRRYARWFEQNLKQLEAMVDKSLPSLYTIEEQDAMRFARLAADDRFDEFAEGQYQKWAASANPRDAFSQRMTELRGAILLEIKELWSSGQAHLQGWSQDHRQPEVEVALDGKVKRWEHRAHTVEIVRHVSRDQSLEFSRQVGETVRRRSS